MAFFLILQPPIGAIFLEEMKKKERKHCCLGRAVRGGRSLLLLLAVLAAGSCRNAGKSAANGNAKEDAVQDSLRTEDSRGYIVRVGDPAPDFTLSLTDGYKVNLSDQRGKVVMLQFTASWCGVCRQEMPHIESRIWQRHRENPDFVLLAIDRDEPREKALALAEATGITYPIGLDPGGNIFALYAERNAGITRNVVIGRDGRIEMMTRLFDEEEFGKLVRCIDSLLDETESGDE